MEGETGFSFGIIAGANAVEDFTYYVVQVHVPFRYHQREEHKHLPFFRYVDVLEPLHSTEYFLGCVCLCMCTDNDVNYNNMQAVLYPYERPTPFYNMVDFRNSRSVVQIVRERYGIVNDLRRVHCVTNRFCLNQLLKLGNAVEEESQNALDLYYPLCHQFCFYGTP